MGIWKVAKKLSKYHIAERGVVLLAALNWRDGEIGWIIGHPHHLDYVFQKIIMEIWPFHLKWN